MITLSETAAEQIRKMMSEQKLDPAGTGVRVGVKPSGCSGFSYTLDFQPQPAEGDQVLTLHGLRIFLDSGSAPYLQGVLIDWAGGLLGAGFRFSNPQATKTCGCGESFSVS
ncbi:MAG: iron-sulfur cluster assembly accessory protein [Candidatus Rokubacteria bacterium]|nr:iron-sulfur cluster assembly accessory protein [Candidatus Rokubacteria bacterium]